MLTVRVYRSEFGSLTLRTRTYANAVNFLERLTQLGSKEVHADQAFGAGQEAFLNVGSSIPTSAEAAELMEPAQGAFDNPADGAQAAAMFRSAAGDDWFDAQPAEQISMGLRIVGPVG